MSILDIAILIFIIMETVNVSILYFAPNSRLGNGVAVFDGWEKSKENENIHLFIRYMTNWVAGTKLIFIVLLLVILLFGGDDMKPWAVGVMILSIATYFWRLHPIIKELDNRGEITPKGYSVALFFMIAGFIVLFGGALAVYFIT